jgi:hypothetical protein
VCCCSDQQFDCIDDALPHGADVLGDERFDAVPVIDLDLPTYWAGREGQPPRRVIGTEIVSQEH